MKKEAATFMSVIHHIVPFIILWGAGFFFSMLWFMLMADTLASGITSKVIPANVLTSIITFYTVIFGPMTWLIKIVFLVMLISMGLQLTITSIPWYMRYTVFITNAPPIFMAALYIIPTTDRLISNIDTPEIQSQLARTIHNGHLIAVSCVILMIVLQFIIVLRLQKQAEKMQAEKSPVKKKKS